MANFNAKFVFPLREGGSKDVPIVSLYTWKFQLWRELFSHIFKRLLKSMICQQ